MKFNRAKLKFSRTMVLKDNMLLSISFSPVEYTVNDLEIVDKKINFTSNFRYFKGIDAAKLGIDLVKE